MKYNSLFAIAGVALAAFAPGGTASAERITAREAGRIANSFVASNAVKYRKAPAAVVATPVYAPQAKGETLLYVFNNPDDSGFTIVSGDDALPAVIGYSTSGAFDYDALPPSMRWWLDGMEREIAYYYKGGAQARIIRTDPGHEPVATLMTTTWNQDSPYNDLCPMDGAYRSYTGCVATAMAQVLKYHAWPPRGRGSANGVNFDEYTYDFANMLDHYYGESTSIQRTEVATLMLHCGYAAKMNYSATGSGANDANMHRALMENFRYNPGTRLNFRDFTTAEKWDALIYGEVAASRPVIMTGYANGGGHCFVVDGYEGEGYFHLNWGWGGYQDGGYLLYLLNPDSGGAGSFDGGYNSGQTAISCMWPEGVNDTPQQSGLKVEYPMSYNTTTGIIDFNGDGVIYNPYGVVQSGVVGLAFEDIADPDNVTDYDLMEFEDLDPYYGWRGLPFEVPADLPDGTYKVYPYTKSSITGERVLALFPSSVRPYMVGEVKGGEFTETEAGATGQLLVSRLDGLDDQYAGNPAIFSVALLNTNEAKARVGVSATIYDAEGNEVAATDRRNVNVEPQSTYDYVLWADARLAEGSYSIAVSVGDEAPQSFDFVVKPAIDDSYLQSALTVNAITDNTFNLSDDVEFQFVLYNGGESTDAIPDLYIYDENMKEIYSMLLQENRVYNKRTLTCKASFGHMYTSPGRYFFCVKSKGVNISPLIPIYFYEYEEVPGKLAYYVTDSARHRIRVAQPKKGEYAETVDLADFSYDYDYTLTELSGDGLSFASDIDHVVLPASVERVGSGALYNTALRSLTFTSDEAPVLMPLVVNSADVAAMDVLLPDGAANKYGRAAGWEQMDLPNWTFTVADGITMTGLDKDKDGNVFAPYFTDSDDTLTVNLSGDRQIYVHLLLPDGSVETIEVKNGSVTLPAVAHGNAFCEVSYDPTSGIETIETAGQGAVYTLDGILVNQAATADDLRALPKGIYLVGGRKVVKR